METNLIFENGVQKIKIDNTIYEPYSFKSFRPTARNISDFYNAGVRLFTILSSGLNSILGVPYSLFGESWLGIGQYDLSVIDRQIELFRENAPDGYFALMIQLDTRKWWLDTHENYPNSFTNLSQMASDAEWRREAANYLHTVLTHVEEKYGDRMFGYFLLCGTTTEWFSEGDYEASHPLKEAAYRTYTGDPHAVIPSADKLNLPSTNAFVDDPEVVRYRRFHAEQTADTILYFAAEAQKVLGHKKLLGLYFGYLFELCSPRLWNTGHLAYEKVFTSPNIDMISSPSSYGYRGIHSTSAFMLTYRSLVRHNKLYFLEFDHITHIAPSHIDGFEIPGGKNKCKDQTETLNLMQRDFLLCAANGASLWWFDMFEGWFYSDAMMENVRTMLCHGNTLGKLDRSSAAEIAVIASGETLYGVNKNASIGTKLLHAQREGFARMGAPYDIYTQGDLPLIDFSGYRMVIFLDAFTLTAEQKAVVDTLKADGKLLFWIYAPGYLDGKSDAFRELIDMTVVETDENVSAPVSGWGELSPLPRFAVCDRDTQMLDVYGEGDDAPVAAAIKRLPTHTSAYSATINVHATLLRTLAQKAGVHIYSENNANPVYVNRSMIGVYAVRDGEIRVREDGVYVDLFTGEETETKNGMLPVTAGELHAKLYVKKELLK